MPKIITNIFVIIFFASIVFYIGQGILFESTWYTKLAGFYFLLFNAFCTILVIAKKRITPLFLFILFLTIWVLLLWIISEKKYRVSLEDVSTFSMIQHIILVITSLISFFYISSKGYIKRSVLVIFVCITTALFVYNILHFDVTTLGEGEYNFSSANNKAYSLTALFPFFLIFWNRKWLMIIFMIASLVFVVFCLKRGAMICIASSVMITFYMIIKQNKRRHKYVLMSRLLIFAVIIAAIYAFSSIYSENEVLQGRFDHGSKPREEIYGKIATGLKESNLVNLFAGNGPLSTVKVAGNYAHNDWLEILYDFGLVGLFVYIMIIVSMLILYRKLNLNERDKTGMLICITYILIRSTVSMCVYELETLLIFGYYGYIIGNYKFSNRRGIYYEKD